MHILGVILISLCPVIIGFLLSLTLSKRRSILLTVLSLLERLKTEIRYSGKELVLILEEIGQSEQFQNLDFISICTKRMKEKIPFPEAWNQAIQETSLPLNREDREHLFALSHILGASDAQGQITSLDLMEQNLEQNYQTAKEQSTVKGKLYRSLGSLSGLALAILLL